MRKLFVAGGVTEAIFVPLGISSQGMSRATKGLLLKLVLCIRKPVVLQRLLASGKPFALSEIR